MVAVAVAVVVLVIVVLDKVGDDDKVVVGGTCSRLWLCLPTLPKGETRRHGRTFVEPTRELPQGLSLF